MTGRALRRYVEDLLHGRRPRRFRADDADPGELRAAITLRAARPGDDAPAEEFVSALRGGLRPSSTTTMRTPRCRSAASAGAG